MSRIRSTGRHAQFATAANDCPYKDATVCRTPECETHTPGALAVGAEESRILPQPRALRPRSITMSADVRDRLPAYWGPRTHDTLPAFWAVLACGHVKHIPSPRSMPVSMGDIVICRLCPSLSGLGLGKSVMVLAAGLCDCHGCGGDSWIPRGTSRLVQLPNSAGDDTITYTMTRRADGTYDLTSGE